MSQYGYEDFLKDEARFFKLWHEKVCKPALLGMVEQIDKAWDEAFQQAKTNHDAVPEARAKPSSTVNDATLETAGGAGLPPDPVGTGNTHRSVEESSRPRRAHNPEIAGANPAAPTLDAVPEARAKSCDDCGPQATPELGNPVLAPPQDGTGNTQEPVAWAVVYPNNEVAVVAFKQRDADELATASDRVVPLYRHSQPTLTEEERQAIKGCTAYDEAAAAIIRKMLERLGGDK